MARAQTRKTIRESKRNSFKKYVSKVNNNTPTSKIFKIIKKLKGTLKDSIQHISYNNTNHETEKSVANAITSSLSTNSSANNYNNIFINHEKMKKKNG